MAPGREVPDLVAAHLLRHAAAQSPHLPVRGPGPGGSPAVGRPGGDRELMSLVMHQIAHREQALLEV
jgi:hypothetical protein